MPVTSTPIWHAPTNGTLNDPWTGANAQDVNQFLGAHASHIEYSSFAALLPGGTGATAWGIDLSTLDIDQPFTLSLGTTIGRVLLPLLAVGNGADVLVSLCTNNAGAPGTVITQTRFPASFIVQQSSVVGASVPSTQAPTIDSTGSALATAAGSSLLYSGWQSVPWSPPATGPTGGLATAQLAQSGPFLIFAGGVNAANGNSSATVAVITWTGGATVSAPVPAPQLPQPLLSGGLAVTSDSLCYVGGVNVSGASFVVQSTVYLASWDTTTGALGAWSVQSPLPHALVNPGIAAYAPTGTVYVVGGSTTYAPASAVTPSVYYATVASGQITAWTAAAPLPTAVADPTVAVVGNFLIAAGGYNAAGNGVATVYYAPINTATGAPGAWLLGPAVPGPLYVEGPAAVSGAGIAWPQTLNLSTSLVAQDTLTLTWGDDGPGHWTHQVGPITVLNQDQVTAIMQTDSGASQIFNFQDAAYITAEVLSVPLVTFPLPAAGLVTGTTYHILIQQVGGDLNNYLRTLTDSAVFTGSPTALTSPRRTYTWAAVGAAGTAVPLEIADNGVAPAATMPRHLWDDGGARLASFIYTATPDRSLLGICEATQKPKAVNANPGFEFTLTPWTVGGGTYVRSAGQAHRSDYSCQVTPSGSAATVYIQSELLPCLPGQQVTAVGDLWFTLAVTSNASISVNWYGATGTFLSTSSNNVSASPSTWQTLANTFTAPAGAYQFAIKPALSGTPAAAQVFYVDNAYVYYVTGGEQNATVTQINWPGAWPAPMTTPTGATQVA